MDVVRIVNFGRLSPNDGYPEVIRRTSWKSGYS